MLVGNAMILTLFKGRWAGRKPIGVFIVAESCGNKITTTSGGSGGGSSSGDDTEIKAERSFWKSVSNLKFHSALHTRGQPAL
jgi:hypothetical protein